MGRQVRFIRWVIPARKEKRMAKSLNDILVELRTKAETYVVRITLTIHSQAKTIEAPLAPYNNYIYFGYGALCYYPKTESLKPSYLSSDYLAASPTTGDGFTSVGVKVIANGAYSSDIALRSQPFLLGSEGDYQAFLVKGAGAQIWGIQIEPPSPVLGLPGSARSQSPARLTITRPGRDRVVVDLVDDNAFLRGIGPDPAYPNEKALYGVVFGDIAPYSDIV